MRLNCPFKVIAPLFYLMCLLSILLYILFSPLLFLYGLVLSTVAWKKWKKRGKDVLVIHNGERSSEVWIEQILPLVKERAEFLNYEESKDWRRWSLPVQLFYRFGPQPIPQSFVPHFLPAVIVLRSSRLPKKFCFGRQSELETNIRQLRLELAKNEVYSELAAP